VVAIHLTPDCDLRAEDRAIVQVISRLELVDFPPCLEGVAPCVAAVLVAKSTVHVEEVTGSHNILVVRIDGFELRDVL
jgi:hypothetical protein